MAPTVTDDEHRAIATAASSTTAHDTGGRLAALAVLAGNPEGDQDEESSARTVDEQLAEFG